MKTKLSVIIALSFLLNTASSQTLQTCTNENFSSQASGWTYSQGVNIDDYQNPAMNCAEDRGIITPGVGGNNPCNIQTPSFTSTGATMIDLTFDMFVLNANLKCNSWKDYPCQTSVDVFYYVGETKYTGIIDMLLPSNGPTNITTVSLSFNTGNNLPIGTVYKIELCFKPKSGVGNCVQQNTKYVFDNFRNCETAGRDNTGQIERQGNSQEHSLPSEISVYPSPTRGSTKVTVNGEEGIRNISLFNIAGDMMRSVTGVSFIVFDIRDLPPGKYYIQFEKMNGEWVKKSLTITRN